MLFIPKKFQTRWPAAASAACRDLLWAWAFLRHAAGHQGVLLRVRKVVPDGGVDAGGGASARHHHVHHEAVTSTPVVEGRPPLPASREQEPLAERAVIMTTLECSVSRRWPVGLPPRNSIGRGGAVEERVGAMNHAVESHDDQRDCGAMPQQDQ